MSITLTLGLQMAISQDKSAKKDCRKDADDDGINDCFDRCPNTPKGIGLIRRVVHEILTETGARL
ncbi:MAG: hypothetical protein HWD58_12555 [Bacteroidota bacterium]|nr:MAG: hypothetical protein HWD58_12555 [Bacteroidota bacterium]